VLVWFGIGKGESAPIRKRNKIRLKRVITNKFIYKGI
jgi:hypothetical protein